MARNFKYRFKNGLGKAKKEAQIRSYYGIDECYYFNFNLWDIRDIKRAYFKTNGMSKYWNNSKINYVELSNI